jgi:hypothetical protein
MSLMGVLTQVNLRAHKIGDNKSGRRRSVELKYRNAETV